MAGNIQIPAGAASATFALTPIDDAAVEGAETVIVTLKAKSAYLVIAPSSATVTIADNDITTPPTPSPSPAHRIYLPIVAKS